VKREHRDSLKHFLVEFVVYAALVFVYYWLVLRFLGPWLYSLFQHQRTLYAWVALGLIVGQGVVLELLTRWLLGFFKVLMEKE
jgi:hypothetical protein